MALKRVEVHYSGRVQGVGFRFTAENFASAYKLVGYVRNMPDGKVELVAEGEEAHLKEFLDAVKMDLANYIEKYFTNWFPPTGEFKRFTIKTY
jgi:acylphosphatase